MEGVRARTYAYFKQGKAASTELRGQTHNVWAPQVTML
jgi:hypothetical protein